MRVAIWLPCS